MIEEGERLHHVLLADIEQAAAAFHRQGLCLTHRRLNPGAAPHCVKIFFLQLLNPTDMFLCDPGRSN
jgi:hypothetical protein